jgi:nitric oxide reductase NorD protein
LAAAHAAARWLGRALPGFSAWHDQACAAALSARPDPATLRGRAALIEGARCAALRGERPWRDAALLSALRRAPHRGADSPAIAIWGELLPAGDSVGNQADATAPQSRTADGTEIDAPAKDHVRRVQLDQREQEEAVLLHTFEKIETVDSHRGGARDTCGDDELDEHAEAIAGADIREVIRGGDDAHSLMRMDIRLDDSTGDVADADTGGIPYDEWDVRRASYRRGWCRVFPQPLTGSDPRWAAAIAPRYRTLITQLQRRIEAHRSRLHAADRQRDGDDVDLAALIDEHAARRAGHGGNQRLYVRQERRRRDLAVCVLIDVSLSTDGWTAGRRVLDVAREAVLVLGEVCERLGDPLRVLAFASQTRNRCWVYDVRGWREPWAQGRARLGALHPVGYTRIGPAIRHATAELLRQPAERRLLLLISDGKPTDYDRYEGRHGHADVRQALLEAGRSHVNVHALAIDAQARDHLPAMFGPGRWHLMPRPDVLPEALGAVYARLTAA